MSQLIETAICFCIAWFVFLKAYSILNHHFMQKFFNNRINLRMQDILSKQELLYDNMQGSTKISAFDIKNKERLDELLSAHRGALDNIKLIIRQSGIKMTLTQLMSACISGGITLTAAFLELHFLEPVLAVPIGMSVGIFLIYSLLAYQASRRKQEFLKMFPDTIDMMIRGVKAGLNLSRIIRLVSIEAKDPIASEFNTMLQKMELGVPYDKVFIDAANEVDIEEFRFLSVAFILQIENGGMLAEILSNLGNIVRKRLELQLKIRAMSSESRMSALVLCALPFVFAGIMMILNPDHLKEFLKPGLGQTLLKVGCGLYFLGVVSMLKVTKMKV